MLSRRVGPVRASALGGFVLAALATFNLGSWFFYGQARDAVESELRARLMMTARCVAVETEGLTQFRTEWFNLYDYGHRSAVHEAVASVFRAYASLEQDLSEVFLMDRSDRILVSSDPNAALGEAFAFAELDRAEINDAISGSFSATYPESHERLFFLSAYGPIKAIDDGEDADFILGIKADPRYEKTFIQIRNGILIANLISGVAVVVLAVLFYQTGRGLARQERALFEQEKLATVGQLAAGLAHEIRNPLGVIKQVSTLFRRKARFEGAESSLDYLDESVERINKQVEDVLSYTRREKAEKRPGDLGKTIDRALALLDFKIRRANVSVEKRFENRSPISFDPDRMEQVAMNLILNAVEAMPNGGALTIWTKDLDEAIEIVFQDAGAGIDPKIKDRVFEPFLSSKEEGTGLGLAIVKRIVETHGGSIRAESEPGKGARFVIRIPVEEH